ncbi:MAG: hypothetical protein IKO47_09560 [Ruminococcus sp.]|nr:hypothetical protein [Ruminococcus sp.]
MKKILLTFMAVITAALCLTGCGSSEKSKEDLNKEANSLYKAASAALVDLDAQGCKFPKDRYFIDSDMNVVCESDKDSAASVKSKLSGFITAAKTYAKDSVDIDGMKWILVCRKNDVEQVYIAEAKNTKTIGTYPDSIKIDSSLNFERLIVDLEGSRAQ